MLPFALDRLRHPLDANRVPHLERAEFPCESPAHGAVHVDNAVGDFRNAARGVQAGLAEAIPEEAARFVAALAFERGRGQHANPLARVFDRLARFDRAELAFSRGAILHLLPVERKDFRVAALLDALVESAARLLAEPSFAIIASSSGGTRYISRDSSSGNALVEIADDVGEHVEADDIRRAERRRIRPADRRPRARVDFLDRHIERLHLRKRLQNRECADAIGDEVRRVLRDHHALAERDVADLVERASTSGSVFGPGISSTNFM